MYNPDTLRPYLAASAVQYNPAISGISGHGSVSESVLAKLSVTSDCNCEAPVLRSLSPAASAAGRYGPQFRTGVLS